MSSIFSGKAGRTASIEANKNIFQGLSAAGNQLYDAKNAATGYLNQNPNIYNASYNDAVGKLDNAYADAKGQMAGNADYYKPFYETGTQAQTALGNALGLNGAEGYAQAMQQFRTGPGYQFQMDAGLDAINRTAAARGGLASGNNTIDLMKYGQGMADQSWQTNIGNLNNQVNTGMQAAQGMANANQNLATLTMNYGNQGASLAQGLGDRLAGNNNALAGNEMNTGNALAGMTSNAYNQMSQNTAQGYMAGQQAAQNRFGAITGALTSGLGFLGKFM